MCSGGGGGRGKTNISYPKSASVAMHRSAAGENSLWGWGVYLGRGGGDRMSLLAIWKCRTLMCVCGGGVLRTSCIRFCVVDAFLMLHERLKSELSICRRKIVVG